MTEIDLTLEQQRQQTIDHLWETLPPVWNKIRCNVRAMAAESFGISVEHFHILRQIGKGLASVSELADEKGISRAGVSQAVDGLVGKGLVERRASTGDRRFVQLAVTSEGRALLDAIFQQNRTWMKEKLADLQPDELQRIDEALELLRCVFLEQQS